MDNEEIIKQLENAINHLYEIDSLRKAKDFEHLHGAIVTLEYIQEKIGE